MVELEIQTLSERREGLLIDVGRSVTESGFTLQRQRLVQDPNGALLTMIVRGPSRGQRALESALEAHERIISFDVSPYTEGEIRTHFAASRSVAARNPPPPAAPALPAKAAIAAAEQPGPAPAAATPAPAIVAAPVMPVSAPAAAPMPEPKLTEPPNAVASPVVDLQQELAQELERMLPPAPAPVQQAVPAPAPAPFVELATLDPDTLAVDTVAAALPSDYPDILPRLLELDHAVAAGAREPSLELAGRRVGGWVAGRDHAHQRRMGLLDALAEVALPALAALVEIERAGAQLHIRHSPLCSEDGHSGCSFYNGFLQGVLGPVMDSTSLTIFPVCCRSFGADACVLALSE